MVHATPIQPGQVTIDAVLEGGPSDMPQSHRVVHGVAPDAVKIKVPHRGGYEHFVRGPIDTILSPGQESVLVPDFVTTVTAIYHWSARTEVAE
jgi:hypothetical protein